MGTETEDYYFALRRLAIRKHVRMATGGRTVPNGGGCELCKGEWNEGEKEKHDDRCLAAPDRLD